MMNETDESALSSLVAQHGLGDVLSFLAKRCRNAIEANVQPMIDISSSHLTARDSELLTHVVKQPIRITSHEHGWIVFINPADLGAKGNALRAYGYSRTFVAVYMAAASMDKAPILINFESDGAINPEFPTFEW